LPYSLSRRSLSSLACVPKGRRKLRSKLGIKKNLFFLSLPPSDGGNTAIPKADEFFTSRLRLLISKKELAESFGLVKGYLLIPTGSASSKGITCSVINFIVLSRRSLSSLACVPKGRRKLGRSKLAGILLNRLLIFNSNYYSTRHS
jgi:hypothetical protein